MILTTSGPSKEFIVQLYRERQSARGEQFAKMRELRSTYNGDVIIPLPEVDKNEKPAIANLINVGLNQTAMRIASVTPNLFYPALREGIEASEKKANSRTKANLAWWEVNKMKTLMRKRSRFILGYSHTPVIIRPDTKWGAPKWDIRNPLDSFPPLNDDPSNITPDDFIFAFTRSRGWLKRMYPDAEARLKSINHDNNDDQIDIVEYYDANVTVVLAVSRDKFNGYNSAQYPGTEVAEIARIPNRMGICPVVNPTTINLDKPMGNYDAQIGSFYQEAKLMALEIIAVQRNIFADTYLVSNPGELGRFVQGPFDGRTGKVNVITGGQIVTHSPQPNQMTSIMIDRMERNQRVGTATPSEFGGESPTNVRTGRRGNAVISETVDYVIQEIHEIFEESLQEENKRGVAVAKTYFGSKKASFYISDKKYKGDASYVPNEIFETDVNIVSYPQPGLDSNNMMVGLGQRTATGEMSIQTMREIDPMIENAELEKDRVTAEAIDKLILESLTAQGQSGAIPISDLARIKYLVKTDKKELAEAITQVQEEAQKRQAALVAANAPEAQPGLALPGAGAESQVAPSGPPSIASLFSNMRGESNAAIQTKLPVG